MCWFFFLPKITAELSYDLPSACGSRTMFPGLVCDAGRKAVHWGKVHLEKKKKLYFRGWYP